MVHLGIGPYYNLTYNYFLDKSISWLILIVNVSQSRLQIVPVILLWTISILSLFKTDCKGCKNSVTTTSNTVNRKKNQIPVCHDFQNCTIASKSEYFLLNMMAWWLCTSSGVVVVLQFFCKCGDSQVLKCQCFLGLPCAWYFYQVQHTTRRKEYLK